jgi:hypothetical protein
MIEIPIALVADAANISREGKLNIMGSFNNISAASFPATHPFMVLVFVLEGDRSDADTNHSLKIDIIDEDGRDILPPLEGSVRFGQAAAGGKLNAPQILQFANVKFERPGKHEIKIILNNEVRKVIPLIVDMVSGDSHPAQ